MDEKEKLDVLATVKSQFPDLDFEDTLRISEWIVSGNVPLDPQRVDHAGEEIARMLGKSWSVPEAKNQVRGIVQECITRYFE